MGNKKVLVVVISALLVAGSVIGYFVYDNNRKNEIKDKMYITFTDVKEIEYGTKNFDVKKELVKEVKEAKLTDVPKLDTTKIGEITLKFTLTKSDVMKEVEHKINVVDTKAPEITLEVDSKDLTVGDEYDIKSNIKSVTDVVDGDIPLVEDVKTINEKATEEYSKLKKEDITDETVIAEKKVSDFFVETTKNEESGEETTHLYLRNCYYIDGTVDTAKAGEYKISIVAVDKNGVKTSSEFTVIVKEKEIEKPVVSNGNGGGSSGGNSGSGSSSSGGGSSSYVGSKQDIINLALAQVGKTYAINTQGPNSFDCSGLIWYAYTQNGWSIPRRVSSSGTRLGSYAELQPGDIIYMPSKNHISMYIGNNQMVEALNPQQGIQISSTYFISNDSQFIRY